MRRKILFISILILALVLVSGCSWFTSPEKMVKKMIAKMSTITSLDYDLAIKASGQMPNLDDLTGQSKDQGEIGITVKGESEFKDIDQAKSDSQFSLTLKSGGNQFILSGEARSLEGENYIKLNEAPNLGFLDLSKITGQWYLFEKSNLGAWSPTLMSTGQKGDLTPKQEEAIRELAKKTEFLDLDVDLGKEKIKGVKTKHLRVKINEIKTIEFARQAAAISKDDFTNKDETELRELIQKFNNLDIEIWIGVDYYLLYQVSIKGDLPTEKGNVSLDVLATMWDFNQTVNVEKPTGAKEFNLLESMGLGSQMPVTVPEMAPGGGLPSNFEMPDFSDLELPEGFEMPEGFNFPN